MSTVAIFLHKNTSTIRCASFVCTYRGVQSTKLVKKSCEEFYINDLSVKCVSIEDYLQLDV